MEVFFLISEQLFWPGDHRQMVFLIVRKSSLHVPNLIRLDSRLSAKNPAVNRRCPTNHTSDSSPPLFVASLHDDNLSRSALESQL